MPEMKHRRERRGLLPKAVDQLGGIDSRIAGNVVDRFLGVEGGALPARLRQCVEYGAPHLQHAAFEHGEQPDRPGADDRDIAAFDRSAWHAATLAGRDIGASALGPRKG